MFKTVQGRPACSESVGKYCEQVEISDNSKPSWDNLVRNDLKDQRI